MPDAEPAEALLVVAEREARGVALGLLDGEESRQALFAPGHYQAAERVVLDDAAADEEPVERAQELEKQGDDAKKTGDLRSTQSAWQTADELFGSPALQRKLAGVTEQLKHYNDAVAAGKQLLQDARAAKDKAKGAEAIRRFEEAKALWQTPEAGRLVAEAKDVVAAIKETIAVVDFQVQGDVGVTDVEKIVPRLLLSEFGEKFELVTRTQLETVLREKNLQFTDLMTPDKALEKAKLLPVKYLVVGEVMKGAEFWITAQLVEVGPGLIRSPRKVSAGSYSELEAKIPTLAKLLHMSDEEYRKGQEQLPMAPAASARTKAAKGKKARPQPSISAVPVPPPSVRVVPAPKVGAPTATIAPVANTADAAITISCLEPVRLLPLEVGQPRIYDSDPVRRIESISPQLSGWQFVSIPKRSSISYEIHVHENGVLYAFGTLGEKNPIARHLLGTEDTAAWKKVRGMIGDSSELFCLRRDVTAGEIIKLSAMDLQLAAKSIHFKGPSPATSPAPAPVAPQPAQQPGQPWTNSLGMKFVPVPGTSVQFSIWDTRVQDYQAFVTATGRAWKTNGFAQGPTHPAVQVEWIEAKSFCTWLTEKERRAGVLTATQEYRLPTDAEWSVAVGLPPESGDTPEEKSGKIKDVYPWGHWPPQLGAGNYSRSLQVDDFDHTSPVGSFAPNRFGLHDMGGNVWQWCEDLYGDKGLMHVMRGASWYASNRDYLLSSARGHTFSAGLLNGDRGFRCVLAGDGVSASR